MDNELLQRLQSHLLEYFPHLTRVWERDSWDDFITTNSAVLSEIVDLMNDSGSCYLGNEERINAILFDRKAFSPFIQVKSVIEHQFPRFHQKLTEQDPVVRLNILIDLTIFCSQSRFTIENLSEGTDLENFRTDLALTIASYLHQFL
ncbi:hypothetical protein BDD43_1181 [Mucilaginibacter gracilis]|uniref:Uncharacterized protein n=1 Tax=Mucilaginibacter gracilis TaxID=423350 RepID=A0A495IY92_9SPHI|nr:hypothetical protein [Mucilaginibacter gracilis]RKR81038.1 hypothetical protein BDD43_1181 [Mucilaginibacter gracilis]